MKPHAYGAWLHPLHGWQDKLAQDREGTIKDMRDCNKLLEYAKQTSEEGIYFASTGIIWDDAVVCSISD